MCLDVGLIKYNHSHLRRLADRGRNRVSEQEIPKTGERLPLEGLSFFRVCHMNITANVRNSGDGNYISFLTWYKFRSSTVSN